MQPMTVVRIMPVIQKVIMKQCSPYQHLSIHGKMQKLRYSTTVFRNSDAVIKNRHIAVLDIIFTHCSTRLDQKPYELTGLVGGDAARDSHCDVFGSQARVKLCGHEEAVLS